MTLNDELIRVAIEQAVRQEREKFIVVGDKMMEMLSHADFSNGVEAYGMDEGRVRAHEMMKELETEWQALKEGGTING